MKNIDIYLIKVLHYNTRYATAGYKSCEIENISSNINNESNMSTFIILLNRVLEVLATTVKKKRENVLESFTKLNFPPKSAI